MDAQRLVDDMGNGMCTLNGMINGNGMEAHEQERSVFCSLTSEEC